jgi:hypothetical protein
MKKVFNQTLKRDGSIKIQDFTQEEEKAYKSYLERVHKTMYRCQTVAQDSDAIKL